LAFQLINELKKILPGFDYFRFEAVGEKHRLLKVYFREESETAIGYNFGELSEGQRMLIALYSLLYYIAHTDQSRQYTLCLDEPENFLALPEIQPWLTELYDSCMEGKTQALLISHHPELINYLLASPVGYWFERQTNRPTRVRPITPEEGDGLPISEIIARGWLNG
jgi:predicted ATPase